MIFYDFYEMKSLSYVGTALSNTMGDFTYNYLDKNNLSFDIDTILGGQTIDHFNDCLIDIRIENEFSKPQYIFDGVTTINEEGKINCTTILDYIDCNFVVQEYDFENITIENVIKNIIDDKFVNNDDTFKLLGLNVAAETSTNGTIYFTQDKFTYTLKDLLIDVFKQFNIVVETKFEYNSNEIKLNVKKVEESILDIDFKTFDAIDFTYTDIEQSTNKVNLYTKVTDETSGEVTYTFYNTYYLLVDGTKTTNPDAVGRISNVVEIYDIIDDTSKVDEYLDKTLINTTYNSELTFRVRKESKIYEDENFYIGKKVRLYTDNFGLIETTITEKVIEKNSGYNTIKCGNNNFDLITILKKKNIL